MELSSEESQILDYLKSWDGKFVSIDEICRNAAGRHRFREEPRWARPLMYRLSDANMVEVDDRGFYRIVAPKDPDVPGEDFIPTQHNFVVGDDYFPAPDEPGNPAHN